MSHETLLMNALKRDGAGSGSVVDALARVLSRQKGLYTQILSLARQQSGHVATGESEALMTVLAARSRLIQDVAPLDRELQPYKGRWQQVLDGLPTADRRVVGELLQEVQRLLGEILAQDEKDKESLMRQKTVVGGELNRAVTGAALNRAYGVDTVMGVELDMQGGTAAAGVSAPMPRSLEDLHEVLQMYNLVTERLQRSHERLEGEVVRLREQLEEKNKELELKKRLAALGEMAAGIAHEIRNPLGGIQLYASTLLAEVSDRPAAAELVRKISNGVKGLNTLVGDMLTFTRDLQLLKQDEELDEIVLEVLELAAPGLLEHDVSVRVHGSVEGKRVWVDRRLLSRVLLNLVLNAAEAIGEAEIRGGKIEIRVVPMGDRVELLIEDNGPGIPVENLERIFDPFFTTKHTGTGLGLAIVHRIIGEHGGQITADNRTAPDHGARFMINLPASDKEPA